MFQRLKNWGKSLYTLAKTKPTERNKYSINLQDDSATIRDSRFQECQLKRIELIWN